MLETAGRFAQGECQTGIYRTSTGICRPQNLMDSPLEVSIAVELHQDQCQSDNQPVDQKIVRMVAADMFKTISILGVVGTLVFHFPPAFRRVL